MVTCNSLITKYNLKDFRSAEFVMDFLTIKSGRIKFFKDTLHPLLVLLTDLIIVSKTKIPQNNISLFLKTLYLSAPGTPIINDK